MKRFTITPLRMVSHIIAFQRKANPLARRLLLSASSCGHFTSQICTQVGPQIYESPFAWRNIKPSDSFNELEQGQSLKIVSWNVDYSSHDPASRIAALLDHIQDKFGGTEACLVIFLQEICHESLCQILRTE